MIVLLFCLTSCCVLICMSFGTSALLFTSITIFPYDVDCTKRLLSKQEEIFLMIQSHHEQATPCTAQTRNINCLVKLFVWNLCKQVQPVCMLLHILLQVQTFLLTLTLYILILITYLESTLIVSCVLYVLGLIYCYPSNPFWPFRSWISI